MTTLTFGILGLFTVLFSPPVIADPVKLAAGEFSAVLQGADPATGELIFEGSRTGALPGHLSIRTDVTRQTGVAMHLATRWTLTTTWGEVVEGENTLILNTSSLHFREHGVVVEATGSLAERIGNFIVIQGEVSDLRFFPGVTEVAGRATIVPSQANK